VSALCTRARERVPIPINNLPWTDSNWPWMGGLEERDLREAAGLLSRQAAGLKLSRSAPPSKPV
jgi:hypothetical protein